MLIKGEVSDPGLALIAFQAMQCSQSANWRCFGCRANRVSVEKCAVAPLPAVRRGEQVSREVPDFNMHCRNAARIAWGHRYWLVYHTIEGLKGGVAGEWQGGDRTLSLHQSLWISSSSVMNIRNVCLGHCARGVFIMSRTAKVALERFTASICPFRTSLFSPQGDFLQVDPVSGRA